MKKIFALLSLLLSVTFSIQGQQYTETVRGSVVDQDNNLPLIGVQIYVANTDPLIGTVTDENGLFKLTEVPVGRLTLIFKYIGYEEQLRSNLVLNSGKELVLEIGMQEALIEMEAVTITAEQNKGETINEMSLLSARSISAEETNRYAGGFNDPSRIMSNFAGVTNTQDGSNDIIVRGNAPKYVQWRLEGIQITNPNHFADPSAVGGAVSTLNNNLLANSDFHTGAFTAEFGDVLSGVYDVRLRNGNNERFEAIFGFGLLGTDITLEGPFKKGYGGSFLVNYRYSTASVISELGLVDIDGVPRFQDATFKLMLPTKQAGVFSLFGLAGLSSIDLADVTPAFWETPGDNFMQTNIQEDFDKQSHLLNLGLNHTINLADNGFLRTTLSYSNEGIDDKVFASTVLDNDELFNTTLNYASYLQKSVYRAATTYNHKFSSRSKLQVGSKFAYFQQENNQRLLGADSMLVTWVDFNENISTVRNFVSFRHRFSERIDIVAGLHNMNVLYNNKHTLEPRFALSWQVGGRSKLQLGYGLHSNMEGLHHYFARIEQPDGSFEEPNRDLDLLKAHHFVAGYEQRFGKDLRARVELYYQHLYDLPVENLDTSYFSTINEGLDYRFVELVNEGTGRNYGLEVTLEKFFSNNYYYMLNASLYESRYTPLDGVERNTVYDGDYLFNLLAGKNFEGLGRKDNQTLGLNIKAFLGGGRKIIPLLRADDGTLAVNPEAGEFWDYARAYEDKIEDAYQVNLSASYKWNRPEATHEFFLNIDNLTNHKGKITEFYDETEPDSVGHMAQFGIFPNIMYRVYF